MEEQLDKKTKDRSPNFPFISLEAALERAKAFYEEERKGGAPVIRAGMHWRYSPNSSGLLQTVSALKSYGLLSDEGSGEARRLKLTELALRIVLDNRVDSPDRQELLRRAALSPNVASEVHANWPDGLPSDETLNHYLVLERSFAPPSALRAVRILKENQEFAKLLPGSMLSGEATAVTDSESYGRDEVSSQSSDSSVAQATRRPNWIQQARIDAANRTAPPETFVEQVLDTEGNSIRIEFSTKPNEDMYEFLAGYIELRLDSYKKRREKQGLAATAVVTPSIAGTLKMDEGPPS